MGRPDEKNDDIEPAFSVFKEQKSRTSIKGYAVKIPF
jgi:hypothetical protein